VPRPDGYAFGYGTIQGVRAYDGSAGTWTTPDAFAGDVDDPSTQKSYMYSGNNPAAYSDPSGYSAYYGGEGPTEDDDDALGDTGPGGASPGSGGVWYKNTFYSNEAINIPDPNYAGAKGSTAEAQKVSDLINGLIKSRDLKFDGDGEIGCVILCSEGTCTHGTFMAGTDNSVGLGAADATPIWWHTHPAGDMKPSLDTHETDNDTIRVNALKFSGITVTTFMEYTDLWGNTTDAGLYLQTFERAGVGSGALRVGY
jgi:RHS repeat-associated protein